MNPEQGRVEFKDIPVNLNRNIDILFVIDNSGSMSEEQANLRTNFPNFINVLNSIQGGLPDVHIGVVTSDMGTKGEDDATPGPQVGAVGQGGCANTGDSGNMKTNGAPVTGVFLSDIQDATGMRVRNYTGDLSTVFGQMASVGAVGCGFEQHLHSMHAALNNNSANAGFLRPDAFLAVIFLADEDDCSMSHSTLLGPDGGPLGPQQSFRCTRFGVTCDVGGTNDTEMNQVGVKDQCHSNEQSQYLKNVASYVSFLKSLKPDPLQVIVAGIIGTTEPFAVELRTINGVSQPALAHSCSYQSGTTTNFADPPVRIQFFLDQFPNRSTATTICQADLSGGLQQIAELLKTAIGNPCIEGNLADVDPNTPGDQYDCTVSYVNNYGKPNQTETVIPPCTAGAQPCWELLVDAAQCPLGDNLILKVNDPGTPPLDTHIIANCVTEAI
ncbi:MAG TPA: hypothetical protein VFQ53_43530 [Kofleriaceae bacterium]|nr:hypothetical protein [Kofleriaceae bacterium]